VNITTYAYDLSGNLVKTTLPDGTSATSTYDLAGRETAQANLDASGTVLRSESATYTLDGQAATSTDYRGDTSTFHYDATGMLVSQTQPVSSSANITVSYGYDLAGNRTALTDGNGNTTYTTYNSRGAAQTVTEPTTSTYTPSRRPRRTRAPPTRRRPTSTTPTATRSRRTCPAECRSTTRTTRWAT
jgi:YD repeat-containing protein